MHAMVSNTETLGKRLFFIVAGKVSGAVLGRLVEGRSSQLYAGESVLPRTAIALLAFLQQAVSFRDDRHS
jgi:hypothetical protein